MAAQRNRTTTAEAAKIAQLARSEGWEILTRYMQDWERVETSRLTRQDFQNLQEVGRLQGQITAYRRIRDWVNNRLDQLHKEG